MRSVAFVYEAPDFPGEVPRKPKLALVGSKSRKKRPPTADELALGVRIQQARLRLGEDNASAFARAVKRSPNTVYRWEDGTVTPDIWSLHRIARETRTTMEWLVSGESVASADLSGFLEQERAAGRVVAPDEIAFLLGLPLMGRQPTNAFFAYALIAYRNGLSPEEAVRAASATEAHDDQET